jgi:Zn-dependent alcohol dehydrogenase
MMRAAVTFAYNSPLELVDDVEACEPGQGQVRVRVSHCGICHSDLHMGGGLTPLPLIAGHEAAGIVEEIGPGVLALKAGDTVVLTPVPSCGKCRYCTAGHPSVCVQTKGWMNGLLPDNRAPFTRSGADVYRGNGVGAWAEEAVVAADAAVKIADDVPLDLACLTGCAVQTGVGAVLNTADVRPGASVLVMGLGAVGLSVVQGARIAGAAQIIVSDPVAERREVALGVGATDAVDPSAEDVAKAARKLSDGGVDYAFDAVGNTALAAAGVVATVPGGAIVLVGAPPGTARLDGVSAGQLVVQEKRLLGCMLGSAQSARDIPRLVEFWRRGLLNLEALVTARRGLDGVNQGLDDIRAGRGVRTVLEIK